MLDKKKKNGINKRFDFKEHAEENARWDRLVEGIFSGVPRPKLRPIRNDRLTTLIQRLSY